MQEFRRTRAGFLKISKLHASARAMRARAEKSACFDCTRVAKHWFNRSLYFSRLIFMVKSKIKLIVLQSEIQIRRFDELLRKIKMLLHTVDAGIRNTQV